MKYFMKKSLLIVILLFSNFNIIISKKVEEYSKDALKLKTLLFDTLQEIGENYTLQAIENQDEVIKFANFWFGPKRAQNLAKIAYSQFLDDPYLEDTLHNIGHRPRHKKLLLDIDQHKDFLKRIASWFTKSLLSCIQYNENAFSIFGDKRLIPLLNGICKSTKEENINNHNNSLENFQQYLDTKYVQSDFLQLSSKENNIDTDLEMIVGEIGIDITYYFLRSSYLYFNTFRTALLLAKSKASPLSFGNDTEIYKKIMAQSGIKKTILFEDYEYFAESGGVIIKCPKEKYKSNPDLYNASMLHEFGHIQNNSAQLKSKICFMLGVCSYQITRSSLPIKTKLALLMGTGILELASFKVDEYNADTFMIKKGTIEQLKNYYDYFLERITKSELDTINDFFYTAIADEHLTDSSRARLILSGINAKKALIKKRKSKPTESLIQKIAKMLLCRY